jgi:hypothetical protein
MIAIATQARHHATSLGAGDQCALAECEAIIERGRDTFIEVGNALLWIREERLYRAEFGTFQEYCEAKWQMSKTHANRLIDAAEIADNLTPTGVTPSSERSSRPLRSLPARVQRRAWVKAVNISKTGHPTEKEVTAAVEIVAPSPKTEPADNTREQIFLNDSKCSHPSHVPSNGLQYAAMAINDLEKIQPNDTQRIEAFQKIIMWICRAKSQKA